MTNKRYIIQLKDQKIVAPTKIKTLSNDLLYDEYYFVLPHRIKEKSIKNREKKPFNFY